MIDHACLGPDIDRSRIAPDVHIGGASYVTGVGTTIAAEALIHDSRIDNVAVAAVPMLGDGSIIRGSEDEPVEKECGFVGSNAVIEANTYLGFGCFVQGTVGPDDGLLPFTIATGAGAHFARYRSLARYGDAQLEPGL